MNNPFKELNYFTGKDQDRRDYAGREGDVYALCARILTSRVCVLYGRSGLGKTSLINAGIFPELEAQGFCCVYVRVLDSPLKDLARTLVEQFDSKLPSVARGCEATEENAGLLLREAAAHAVAIAPSKSRAGLFVVFDQFEEFFTIFKDEPTKRYVFVREIASFIQSPGLPESATGPLEQRRQPEARVMFSLREDHLCALDDFQRQLPDLFSNSYRLMPLTVRGARAAIVKPLEERGIPYDEELVTALLDSLAHRDFESVQLQLMASEAFRKTPAGKAPEANSSQEAERSGERNGQHRFALLPEEVERIRSGAEGVFRRYLDEAIKKVPKDLEAGARDLLDVLITANETKLTLTDEEADAAGREFAGRDEEGPRSPGRRRDCSLHAAALLPILGAAP